MEVPSDPTFVNVTSRSVSWSKGLSPFILGPCELYEGAPASFAFNVENTWQYSKTYPAHIGDDGNPTPEFFSWARQGYLTKQGHRYPMGKGAIPKYSWWAGEKLDYISARKKIYLPVYAAAARKSEAFQTLRSQYEKDGEIKLWCFDGYERGERSYEESLNDPTRPFGHSFVLAMMLEGLI